MSTDLVFVLRAVFRKTRGTRLVVAISLRILEAGSNIDIEAVQILCSALYLSASTRGGMTAPGEPFPHDVRMKEHAEKKLRLLSRLDPAYELFSWLLKDAESGIERQRREKDAIDAEEEETQ
jgi:hypothetical protein